MTSGTDKSDLRVIVEQFYGALIARDADAVGEVIDEYFAADAKLRRPESLPGGGTLEGADRIKRLMVAVASADGGPLDPAEMRVENVLESTAEDEDHVFVALGIPWAGARTEALEWWTIRDFKVVEIRAFYWDTAAMVRAG
jgi:ketosteroid isomerase-like protein